MGNFSVSWCTHCFFLFVCFCTKILYRNSFLFLFLHVIKLNYTILNNEMNDYCSYQHFIIETGHLNIFTDRLEMQMNWIHCIKCLVHIVLVCILIYNSHRLFLLFKPEGGTAVVI